MKKILSIAIAVLLCLTFAACEKRPDAQTDLTAFFEAMKSFDAATATKYLQNGGGEIDTAELESIGFDYTLLTKNLEYEILECTETDDTATASVKISNIKLTDVMADAAPQVIAVALDSNLKDLDTPEFEAAVEAKLVEILEKLLNEGEYEKYETTVEVRLVLDEENWKIENTSAVIKPVIGYIDTGDIGFTVVG